MFLLQVSKPDADPPHFLAIGTVSRYWYFTSLIKIRIHKNYWPDTGYQKMAGYLAGYLTNQISGTSLIPIHNTDFKESESTEFHLIATRNSKIKCTRT